jgi:hypothetical protein
MRERGLTNVGNLSFSGASRWAASESFRVGEFSTGELGKFQPALTVRLPFGKSVQLHRNPQAGRGASSRSRIGLLSRAPREFDPYAETRSFWLLRTVEMAK